MRSFKANLTILMLASAMLILPGVMIGQTPVSMPKNKAKISKDIEIGQKASSEVERTFPMVKDSTSEAYIQSVGDRLARAVPPEFQHPEFNCRFKIVNASDINAFALPGCWLYVNRGMIEAAHNEGEMAGVMAHEISHAMLRHGTANGPGIWSQIGALGMILGGAVVGGEAGAQAGAIGAQAWLSKYSRAFEKQSDILGANIMARAGYDPRDLANMFKTIAEQNPNRPPQWLSSHPDPGNRYKYINDEAAMLNVSKNPYKITPGFTRAQNYMRSLPKAKTMEQIEKEAQGKGGQSPTSGGKYSGNVPFPSTQTRTYNAGNALSVVVPSNWKDFAAENSVEFAPEGAYGDQGITHGAMIGVERGHGQTLRQETDAYIQGLLQNNTYLQAQSNNYSNGSMAGRSALARQFAGTSPITGKTEIVTIYTALLSNGDLFYLITVVPQSQASSYNSAFQNMIRSVKIYDR